MQNNSTQLNVKGDFKINYILFAALLTGLFLFALLAYYGFTKNINEPDENLLNVFMFIVPSIAIVEIFLSRFMYKKIIKQLSENATLFEKLGKYRTAKIIAWAMLEGAGLFAIVAFIITKANFFLIVLFIIIIAFVLSKPSIEEFLSDFRIEGADRNELI